MKTVSVNRSKPQSITIGEKAVTTGIYKEPTAVAVTIGKLGLENDHIADTKHHGGEDQAVYVYSAADYDWWSSELGRPIPLATFGENLTFDHFPDQPLHIGDRFQINDVLLEITFSRIPCSTLGARMGDQKFVKAFAKVGRCGVYTRVLQTGTITQGDTAQFIPTPHDYPTVKALFDLFYDKSRTAEQLQNALNAPIDIRSRRLFESWLEQLSR